VPNTVEFVGLSANARLAPTGKHVFLFEVGQALSLTLLPLSSVLSCTHFSRQIKYVSAAWGGLECMFRFASSQNLPVICILWHRRFAGEGQYNIKSV
jgi:hypothetical protein